jgi:hypothetical protein
VHNLSVKQVDKWRIVCSSALIVTQLNAKAFRHSVDNQMMTIPEPENNLVAPERPVRLAGDPLAEEIARAVEIMKRAQAFSNSALPLDSDQQGGRYILPSPILLQSAA